MKLRIEPRGPSFGETMQNGLEDSMKGATLATGALILGGVALGAAAVKSRRIRLKLMGVLHFPLSYLITIGVLLSVAGEFLNFETNTDVVIACWILGVSAIISIIWSILFIKRYVRPKLKEISDAEYASAAAAAHAAQTSPDILYPPGYHPY
ncbi:MAG: hypothetical protein MR522_02200 [Trueperella sp.]|uniref:hypothetical protein n=1 Tax=Trueperella sp. TaxID=2699835 RepID=UPI0025E9D8A7|nr:hypothetical protein [Trueperella sp.]MCI7305069.1 hypothetical protein [Trueperella sp.]MDY5404076.1 hypothetical protein [Trueperella sp.]